MFWASERSLSGPPFSAPEPGVPCRSCALVWHGRRVTGSFTHRLGHLLGSTLLLTGCSLLDAPASTEKPTSFPVVLSIKSDDKPVAGAKVLNGKQVLGSTNESGKVRLELKGKEGETLQLTVQCPEGLASPEKPIAVGLRVMAAGSPEPSFQSECVQLTHEIVVGVRAERGANLPVLYLDEVVGHTNSEGVAHVKLKVAPKEQITLRLDTTSNPSLRPQNPTLTFVASDKDEMVLLEQKFTVLQKKVSKPKPNIPRPL